MRKFLPYIFIMTIILQLFAPFTIGSGAKNNLEIQKNKVEATGGIFGNDLGVEITPTANITNNSIELTIGVKWVTNTFMSSESIIVGLEGPDRKVKTEIKTLSPSGELNQSGKVIFNDLQPGTTYSVFITASQDSSTLVGDYLDFVRWAPNMVGGWIGADEWAVVGVLFQNNESTGSVSNFEDPYKITTLPVQNDSSEIVDLGKLKNPASLMPECSILEGNTWPGCIGIGLYHLIFRPSSYLFAKTGQLMDLTIGYSVRDESYRSSFVVEGWGVIRDFCNMFFIFILLYIAIGTILNLHSVKPKEMIINVVIIGLLINFSLFATQVIIDASNILTRVFYNYETIQVGPKINGVVQNETGKSGEIKLSEALVSKVNPQSLIMNASELEKLPIKGDMGEGEENDSGISAGLFILVVILASAINIVGLVVFLTCSLLFITRVIGLWFAMIFAPLAFFSYAAPKMDDIEMIGWKKWWPETIKLSFMAPIFVFFLYLIIKFLETGLGLNDADSSWSINKMDFLLKTFLPFIFIMVLLLKAKSIAVQLSGKMGESVSKIGSAVAGLGLAAATGGAAMAMRGTVGRLGNKLATSEWAKTHGAIGRGLGNVGKWTGSKSFDIRATKAGAAAGKELGVDMGKAKEGGYAKHLSEKVERRQKRAKELEVSETETLKQNLNKVETELQDLLRQNSHELEILDKQIAKARENANDLKARAQRAPNELSNEYDANGKPLTNDEATKAAQNKLADLKAEKRARKDAKSFTDSNGVVHDKYKDSAGVIRKFTENVSSNGRSINELEDHVIPHAHHEIEKENRNRKWNYAKAKSIWGGRANKEAAHKIRMEAKMDSGEKSH